MVSLSPIKLFEEIKPATLYLIIFHADKKPPHVGLVWNLRYFSLTVKGKEVDLPFEEKLQLIEKRKIPCLILELRAPKEHTELQNQLVNIFEASSPLSDKISCLAPISNFFENVFHLKLALPLLHGLLQVLIEKELIKENFALHLTLPKNRIFDLPDYDAGNVSERINRFRLLEKKRIN